MNEHEHQFPEYQDGKTGACLICGMTAAQAIILLKEEIEGEPEPELGNGAEPIRKLPEDDWREKR